ncbi:MAG: NADH-dependent alcohol dehydrogenase, partial [Fervidobacterium sp.]
HELEHSLSALKPEVAHGAGLAIVFPAWMMYVKDKIADKLIRFGKNIFGLEEPITPEKAIEELKKWYSSMGAPITLKEVGIAREDIDKLVQHAIKHAPFGTVMELKEEDIRKIYENALE